jgi:hypothetical protein
MYVNSFFLLLLFVSIDLVSARVPNHFPSSFWYALTYPSNICSPLLVLPHYPWLLSGKWRLSHLLSIHAEPPPALACAEFTGNIVGYSVSVVSF